MNFLVTDFFFAFALWTGHSTNKGFSGHRRQIRGLDFNVFRASFVFLARGDAQVAILAKRGIIHGVEREGRNTHNFELFLYMCQETSVPKNRVMHGP